MKKTVALLSLAGLALVVAGCNTVEGVGKDVKATGNAIEKAADKAKPK
jgi:predicted small secreted protein